MKICPIISGPENTSAHCKEHHCAWWVEAEGWCSIQGIRADINQILLEGIKLETDKGRDQTLH